MLTSEWHKRSSPNGQNCVEARTAPGAVVVRDSKDTAGPVLTVTPGMWTALLAGIKTRQLGE